MRGLRSYGDVDRPQLDPVGERDRARSGVAVIERDQPGTLTATIPRAGAAAAEAPYRCAPRTWAGAIPGLRRRCGAVRRVRRPGSQPRDLEASSSAAYSRSDCDGRCEPRCDGVRRQVRTRRSPKPRDSAAFGGSGANLSATGATGRFAPRGLKRPGILRLSGRRCDGWVRTANPDSRPVASEVSRRSPAAYGSRQEGPALRATKNPPRALPGGLLGHFLSLAGSTSCVYVVNPFKLQCLPGSRSAAPGGPARQARCPAPAARGAAGRPSLGASPTRG